MKASRNYESIPGPNVIDIVMTKIRMRCAVCPSCGEKWLWVGNHSNEMGKAVMEYDRARYSVRKTVRASTGVRASTVVSTKCESQNCLNPKLLVGRSKADVIRHQLEMGLIHHAQHRAAIVKSLRHKSAKLNIECAREIRSSNESNVALARRYGVTRQLIYRIRSGESWREPSPFAGLGAR